MSEAIAPPVGDYVPVPRLREGAMRDVKSFKASANHQSALGFPETLVNDWRERAVQRLGELVEGSRALRVYLDSCVKCGACTDKCHYFLGTGDPRNMPVARQDLLRRVYRRYFTWAGRWLNNCCQFQHCLLHAHDTFHHLGRAEGQYLGRLQIAFQ